MKGGPHCHRNWDVRVGVVGICCQGANHSAMSLTMKNVPSTNATCAQLRNTVPQ